MNAGERRYSLSSNTGMGTHNKKRNAYRKRIGYLFNITIVASIVVCSLAAIGLFINYYNAPSEEVLMTSPPGNEENIPTNWKSVNISEYETARYLDRAAYYVFTREFNINVGALEEALEKPLDEIIDEESGLIPEACFLWTPAGGFADLRSADPDKISFVPYPADYQGFPIIEVHLKDWDPEETIKISAVYDKYLVTAQPSPEKPFPFMDGVRYDSSGYITSYDNEHQPGSDAWLDKLYEIARNAESVMDVISVVSNIKESPLTGRLFFYGGDVLSSNSRDTEILQKMEGNCISAAILLCSLLSKYDPSLEPGIIYNLVKVNGMDLAHVEVQIKTHDGYVQFDPISSADMGCLISYGIIVTLDNLCTNSDSLPDGVLDNLKSRNITLFPMVSGKVNLRYYITLLNSLEEEIIYP